jgi:hypothetical protein
VVLDTSALYTGSASYFLRKEVGDLIREHAQLPDLRVQWYVPEVARHERQFQMLQEAYTFRPTVERLERLLGHNLNITPDILDMRVREAVERQILEYGLIVHTLDTANVDWPRVILDATYRRAPFQTGEKEKGFRDALILETLVQIAADTPTSPSVARLAFVSADQLLRDAALARTAAASNVHVLESVDALKGLINTLGSAVDEQFIAAVRQRAADSFYRSNDESSLYYKASVGTALQQALKDAPIQLPVGADRYRLDGWNLALPRFVSKQGQRINWATRFEARLKAVKTVPSTAWKPSPGIVLSSTGLTSGPPAEKSEGILTFGSAKWPVVSDWVSSTEHVFPTGTQWVFSGDEQTVTTGTAVFDVSWGVSVATSGLLTKAALTSVDFVEVVWN